MCYYYLGRQIMSFKHKLVSFIVSLSLGTLFFLFLFLWIEKQIVVEQEQAATTHLALMSTISKDIQHTLERLDRLDDPVCSSEMLLHMRRENFLSIFIKDIGYSDENGKLLCTAGLGIIVTKSMESEPDYINNYGAKVWVNKALELFDRLHTAVVIKHNAFNVVIEPAEINKFSSMGFDWEIVFNRANHYKHVSGSNNLYVKGIVGRVNLTHAYQFQQCDPESSYCVALSLSAGEFYEKNRLLIAIIITSSFFLTLFLYYFISFKINGFMSISARVKRGVKSNKFFPLFQPIVNIQTGKIVGCEVLARFEDNEGKIFPDEFIPKVRELGLSWEFTEQLVEKSLLRLSESGIDLKGFKVNINIFPSDVSSGKVLKIIDLPYVNDHPIKVVLEIVEDEQLTGKEFANNLEILVQHGFLIAIDDFGTGYSNLNQVSKLSCHILKIDRSFINAMEGGSIRSSLIPYIVQMANELHIDVVAEGVENIMQHQALKNLGILNGQGWLYGKPMSADDLCPIIKHFKI
ncbi:EAL domain-containing protein [Shewanella vesiculosa]|uniref:EAL domain-containing protein n=1 Tax=Shewanella vesiculosa TaxID=518738 RepID=UPI003850854D